MREIEHLADSLRRMDGRGYRAYKDIQGAYLFAGGVLHIDHAQGDPFAAPSKLRLRVPMDVARLPDKWLENKVRALALADYLARCMARAIREEASGRRGSGKSGLVSIDAGGQEVLERTALVVNDAWVEARIEVGLPAQGRRVLGRQAAALLCEELPALACHLTLDGIDAGACWRFIECVENQEAIRARLRQDGLVAFIADGAVLPRAAGDSGLPMRGPGVTPFRSPEALRREMPLPHPVDGKAGLEGMGIPEGVTLIVGGGYHGKSTLLQALEMGVYPHVPGDGREYVVTRADAVKIRAEDGRPVAGVDISGFIGNLPLGRGTASFTTPDASGSTSQAAAIIEAIEAGSQALLLDEDTSATNFMVRDARMQALVHKDQEPITPFLDRVRELYEVLGISTLLVMGGCGDYFDVSDTVIMMRDYLPSEVSAEARAIARARPSGRTTETAKPLRPPAPRIPKRRSFDAARGRRDIRIDVREIDHVQFGEHPIALRGVAQLADRSQTRAAAHALQLARERFMGDHVSVAAVLDALEDAMDREGLDILAPNHRPERHPGHFARPRRQEIAAALNRLRGVEMVQGEVTKAK